MLYTVTGTASASMTVTVEADDEEDAREKAANAGSANLCIHCSGYTTSDYDPASDEPPWSLDIGDFDFSDAEVSEA